MKRDSSLLVTTTTTTTDNTLPVDIWQSIMLHCDIEVALAPISTQWSAIARANINTLLCNWIQREASKPESDGTHTTDKFLHPLYRYDAQMHYHSRRVCADFSGMTPCMDFYRAVARLYILERIKYSRYCARWLPCSILLGNIVVIDYDANAAKYNIVPLKYYKHLLRLKENIRHYHIVEFGPNEFTPTSCISVIGQKTCFDNTRSLLSIELKHDAPIEIGDDYVAENPVDFDQKILQQDAHLVYVADGWTLDDIKEYLVQRLRYVEQCREAIAVMDVLEKQYLEKSRADWLDRCRARAAVIRTGFADWNSAHDTTSRLIRDSLFHAETRPIAELLCQLNERGFYTIDSQPTKNQSADAVHRHQRSYIAGYMPESVHRPLHQKLGMSPNDNGYNIAAVIYGSIIVSYDVSAEADGIPIGRVMLPESSGLSGVPRALGVRPVHFIDMDWRRQQPHLFTTLIELMKTD